MRGRTATAVALLLALTLTACAERDEGDGVATAGGPAASASAKGGDRPDPVKDREKFLRFAQCMRENGVPNFPDPEFDGDKISMSMDDSVDPKKVEEAQQHCKQHLPNGGEPMKMDPADVEKMRAVTAEVTNTPEELAEKERKRAIIAAAMERARLRAAAATNADGAAPDSAPASKD